MSKPTQREQIELLKAENDALLDENKAVLLQMEDVKRVFGDVLEDTRIPEHVRREYTQAYIAVIDG